MRVYHGLPRQTIDIRTIKASVTVTFAFINLICSTLSLSMISIKNNKRQLDYDLLNFSMASFSSDKKYIALPLLLSEIKFLRLLLG